MVALDPGRQNLLEILNTYQETWCKETDPRVDSAGQLERVGELKRFLFENPDCFARTNTSGHITGSGLPVTPDLKCVLLTLHGKLNLWLQLGGHADGDPLVHEVALRETEEESGMKDFQLLPYGEIFRVNPKLPLMYDIDIHPIPAHKNDPEHTHYDLRYVVVALKTQALQITDESKDLRWFTIEEAYKIAPQPSMQRQFDKIVYLRRKLGL